MDWGFIIQIGLAVLGAALVVGGIFAFRGSANTNRRPIAAGCAAAGTVMLLVVSLTLPVSSTTS